jgi:hypothetical protein
MGPVLEEGAEEDRRTSSRDMRRLASPARYAAESSEFPQPQQGQALVLARCPPVHCAARVPRSPPSRSPLRRPPPKKVSLYLKVTIMRKKERHPAAADRERGVCSVRRTSRSVGCQTFSLNGAAVRPSPRRLRAPFIQAPSTPPTLTPSHDAVAGPQRATVAGAGHCRLYHCSRALSSQGRSPHHAIYICAARQLQHASPLRTPRADARGPHAQTLTRSAAAPHASVPQRTGCMDIAPTVASGRVSSLASAFRVRIRV